MTVSLNPNHAEKVVEAFINERPGFIQALRSSADTDADYHRWQGHAEARRHLAERLGMTVPFNLGDSTARLDLTQDVTP